MLETVAAIHPCWPEARGRGRGGGAMKSAGLAVWVFFGERKNCLTSYCRSISSGRNDKNNAFHNMIHLRKVPGPKPISKSLLLP